MSLEGVVWVNKTVIDGRTWAQKEGAFQAHWWWVEKTERAGNAHVGGWESVNYINLEEMTEAGLFVLELKLKAAKVLEKKVEKQDYKRTVEAQHKKIKSGELGNRNKTWFG